MADRVPSTFLLVAGPWASSHAILEALRTTEPNVRDRGAIPVSRGEVAVEVVEDPHLARAFAWGRYGRLPESVVGQIAEVGRAALLEIGQRLDEDPARFARLGQALRDAHGLAVRVEASGGASTWDDWLPRMERGLPADLYAASVIVVREDDGTCFTCGMHAFDLPDAEINLADATTSIQWLDAFCGYQLTEQAMLGSGQTFRPHEGAARRTLERWPDVRHHPSDGRHNPFGVWRFVPEGTSPTEAGALVLVMMPSLTAQLAAAEQKRERPLTQPEVEQIVDQASAIAMERADAFNLERARGYADIEPALAWEQWQLVRGTL